MSWFIYIWKLSSRLQSDNYYNYSRYSCLPISENIQQFQMRWYIFNGAGHVGDIAADQSVGWIRMRSLWIALLWLYASRGRSRRFLFSTRKLSSWRRNATSKSINRGTWITYIEVIYYPENSLPSSTVPKSLLFSSRFTCSARLNLRLEQTFTKVGLA